jgi:hypothetical protein
MLDADEVVSPDLADLIPRLVCCADIDSVFVPFLNLIEEQGVKPSHWPLMLPRLYRRHLNYRGRLHEQLHGWKHPIVLPISGPYIVHSKGLLRFYRQTLRYAGVDPTPYPPDWLVWVREEITRIEGEDPSHG